MAPRPSPGFLALLAASLACAACMWWAFSEFVFEDAYITYRYADNLAHGRGFAFTPGERVLGTTAPLYALLLAGLGALGLDIPAASGVLFAASLAAIALLGGHLVRRSGGGVLAILLALVVGAGGPAVQLYWGLETPFLSALLVAAATAAAHRRERLASILIALAFLTRYDAALFAVTFFALVTLRDRRIPWRNGTLALAIVLPWLAFAQLYFGSIFPNTLGAKTGDTEFATYFTETARRQWGLLRDFAVDSWAADGLADVLSGVLLAAAAVGVVAFAGLRARREPLLLVLLVYPVGLLAAYAWIGPGLNFSWYPVPGVFCLLVAAFSGWAELGVRATGRRERPPRPVVLALGAVTVAGALALPGYLAQQASSKMNGLQYRSRVEAYRAMSDWVVRAELTAETLLTHEPGYFAFRSGNPVIDEAGLVTKGLYFHGDAARRTSRPELVESRRPGLVLSVAGACPPGYVLAHAGSARFQLVARADVYRGAFDRIVEAHRSAESSPPPLTGAFEFVLDDAGRARWIELGGITGSMGRPFAATLDGEPYSDPYMFLGSGGFGISSPTFRVSSDRVELRMATRPHPRTRAELIVDGAVVLSHHGSEDHDPREFAPISLDVGSWRGRVAELRFVQWAGVGHSVGVHSVRTANDARRRPLDDFEEGPLRGLWETTFADEPASLAGPARAFGAGLLSSSAAAHTFARAGILRQVSRPFELSHDELRFLLLDFSDDRGTVELLVDGQVVRSVRCRDTRSVRPVSWDVAPWRGEQAVLRAIDGAASPELWLGVDALLLADRD